MTLFAEHGDGGVVHYEAMFYCNFKCKMQSFLLINSVDFLGVFGELLFELHRICCTEQAPLSG